MNTRISSTLSAFAVALIMNALLFCGVAYLFDLQTQPHQTLISLAKRIVSIQWLI